MTEVGNLQILVDAGRPAPFAAGLPPAVRAAHRAAQEFPSARILTPCAPTAACRWSAQLAQGRAEASGRLRPDVPLLVLSPDGFAHKGALTAFVKTAAAQTTPIRAVAAGHTIAIYLPKTGELALLPLAQAAAKALDAEAAEQPFSGWTPAATQAEAAHAETMLCAQLTHATDGFIARFDRRVSIALSRVILRLPITPNQITTAGLAVGLAGAWGVATGVYGRQLAGALALWLCCILDGCDGEVARLKLLCSPEGAAYDLTADHVAHLAAFVAVAVGVHRTRPDMAFLGPATLLLTGFLGAAFSVWWLVLRLPDERRGAFALFIERIASRDYIYLIAAFVAIGRLEWFLWAAGIGAHLLTLTLWWRVSNVREPLPTA